MKSFCNKICNIGERKIICIDCKRKVCLKCSVNDWCIDCFVEYHLPYSNLRYYNPFEERKPNLTL